MLQSSNVLRSSTGVPLNLGVPRSFSCPLQIEGAFGCQQCVAAELRHPCRKRIPSSFNAGSCCIISLLAYAFRFVWGGVGYTTRWQIGNGIVTTSGHEYRVMPWLAIRFRLATLMILVAVVAILLWLNTTPTSICGDGVSDLSMTTRYGRPATCFSRHWIAPFDGPWRMPPDARWRIHPIGLLINLASGVLAFLVCRATWLHVCQQRIAR